MGHNRARERWKARLKRRKRHDERLAKKEPVAQEKAPAQK